MDKRPWRLISGPAQSAALNMAIDEAIAIAFSEGKAPETLRLYRWEKPSFSIGAFQKLATNWIATLEAQDISIVRRMTGGRGLLHDHELTYSVVSSTAQPLFSKGIKGTFQSIAQGLLAGLRQIDVEATLHAPTRKLRPEHKKPLCFDTVSWYEITAQGKKLIGSAQRRWKNHFLQHGSLNIQQSDALKDKSGNFPARIISKNQITLSELMNTPPSPETLAQAIKTGFENALSLNLEPGELSPYEKTLVQQCLREKYARRAWNLYRKKIENP